MPTELAVEAFLELVERSGILRQDQLQQLVKELEARQPDLDTSQKMADELVARGVLTDWQANKLLEGKHKGFLLGPYRILRPLGKGGMGTVFLAEHRMMRRRCAIKVLPSKRAEDESSGLERFYREAQAVAALDHVNIVRAYDVNHAVQDKAEIHYLVMEYVQGSDLQTRVDQGGVLEYREAAELIRQAAQGLAHAHQNGLVHRDIKPANLLVDSSGTVKVLDLGLARFFDDSEEASLTNEYGDKVLGTADYLAPEQALDCHGVDARADIYSLGQTLYFLLTGHPPFPEGSVAQRLLAHQMKDPEPIEDQRPDAPPGLVAIIDRMTAKKPEIRYQTAEEVAQVLAAWLEQAGEEIGRIRRFSRSGGAIYPASRGRREPTRASSSPAEETELELAPLEEEERRSPNRKKQDVADDAGQPSAAESETPADSAAPAAPAPPPPAGPQEKRPDKRPDKGHALGAVEDLPDLASLEPESMADLLAGETLPPAAVDLPPSASSSVKIPAMRKPEKEAEESVAAKAMGSPVFWTGVAGAVVVIAVLILVIVLSGPSTTTPKRGVAVAPSSPRAEEPAPPAETTEPPSPGIAEPAPDQPSEPAGEQPPGAGRPKAPGFDEQETPGFDGGLPPESGWEQPTEEPTPPAAAVDPFGTGGPVAVSGARGARVGETDPAAPGQSSRPNQEPPTKSPAPAPQPARDPSQEAEQEKIDTAVLLAGIRDLSFNLQSADKNPNSKLNLMVKQSAIQAAERAHLTPSAGASTRMNITLEVADSEGLAGVLMSASVQCRVSEEGAEKEEMVEVWRHREQVAEVAWHLLRRGTVPVTIRQGVGDFFDQFVKDCSQARADRAEPPEPDSPEPEEPPDGPADDVVRPGPR